MDERFCDLTSVRCEICRGIISGKKSVYTKKKEIWPQSSSWTERCTKGARGHFDTWRDTVVKVIYSIMHSDKDQKIWRSLEVKSWSFMGNSIFLPRATLKGPKRSFVVVVVLVVLGVETWVKNGTKNVREIVSCFKWQNHCFMFFLSHFTAICGLLRLSMVLYGLAMAISWSYRFFL